MFSGRSIQDVAQQLTAELKTKHDFIIPTGWLTMTVKGELKNTKSGKILPITDHAHGQIATFLKIPTEYYNRMRTATPDLLAHNVNEWMVRQPQDCKRMIRVLNGRGRAFLSDRYLPIDNYDVLSILLPSIIEAGCQIVAAEVTDRRMYIKALAPKITGEIKVGQRVQAGISISNSEIGVGRVLIDPLLYVLACANGAIVQDMSLRRHHVGRRINEDDLANNNIYSRETIATDIKAFLLKARDTVKAILTQDVFSAVVDRAKRAAGIPIDDVEDAMEDVTGRFSLTDDESAAVMKSLVNGGDLTRWGMSNALTAVAHDEKVVFDFDRSVELERAGGELLTIASRN